MTRHAVDERNKSAIGRKGKLDERPDARHVKKGSGKSTPGRSFAPRHAPMPHTEATIGVATGAGGMVLRELVDDSGTRQRPKRRIYGGTESFRRPLVVV